MRSARRHLAVVLVGAALLSGCAGNDADGSAAPTDGATPVAEPTSPAPSGSEDRPAATEADRVLSVSGRALDGGAFDLSTLQGQDTVVWLWTPWCAQCNREAPAVAEALETYGEQIRFVGVAAQDDDDAMRDFLDRHDLAAMTTVADDDGALWSHFGVRVQPAWVFVDADGEVDRVLGELTHDQLFARLAALSDGGGGGGGGGG